MDELLLAIRLIGTTGAVVFATLAGKAAQEAKRIRIQMEARMR